MYRDLDAARRAVRECGEAIADLGTPAEHGPMTFMFTGAGKVSKGAQEMFQQLPHEYVKVEVRAAPVGRGHRLVPGRPPVPVPRRTRTCRT